MEDTKKQGLPEEEMGEVTGGSGGLMGSYVCKECGKTFKALKVFEDKQSPHICSGCKVFVQN